ncbi:hypothetical protein MUK42_32517, partial [Musa troglodytarum]
PPSPLIVGRSHFVVSATPIRQHASSPGGGGVVLTLVAKRRGFEAQVFEKHPSAVRGEGRPTRSPCSTPSTPTSPARSPAADASWAIASTALPTASPANNSMVLGSVFRSLAVRISIHLYVCDFNAIPYFPL